MKISDHFDSDEFACNGTPYPPEWYTDRLTPLCEMLEVIRSEAGDQPLTIDSGYRTLEYDEKLYEASAKDGTVAPASKSQHPQGRAADIVHATLKPHEMFNLILQAYENGELEQLGGLGLYPNFVHVDIRQRPILENGSSHLAIWGSSRPSNVA